MITVSNHKFIGYKGPHIVKVTRPSIFSNPYTHQPCGWGCCANNHYGRVHVKNREEAIILFAEYWYADEQRGLRLMALELPADTILTCVCHPKACHADIIAGYINWKRNDL